MEGNDAGVQVRHELDGRVGEAHEDLRVTGDEIEIDQREQADGLGATDIADDSRDLVIRQRPMKIVDASVRVPVEVLRVTLRVRRLDDAEPERLLELSLPRLIAMRDGPCIAT